MNQELFVTKASGEQRPFSEEKLVSSLRHAGADEVQIENILHEVKTRLYGGISTKKIYRLAFSLLKKGSRHLAARYHLKQAIMELGPSGFPFERYVGEILKVKDYQVQIGTILQGKCITHEIDLIADNKKEQLIIECKYHNYQGVSCDIKIPLYIHARYEDVVAKMKPVKGSGKVRKGQIVTNTRFTEDAIKYAVCMNLNILAWDYPKGYALKDQIDKSGLYPITCLTSLTKAEKQKLLQSGTVLCKEILKNGKILKSIGMKSLRSKHVMEETRQLCAHSHVISV